MEKKWAHAEKVFEVAIQIDPSNPTLSSPYTDFLVARKQVPKAIAYSNSQIHIRKMRRAHNPGCPAIRFQKLRRDPGGVRTGYPDRSEKRSRLSANEAKCFRARIKLMRISGCVIKALKLVPRSAALVTMVRNLYFDKGDSLRRSVILRASLDGTFLCHKLEN